MLNNYIICHSALQSVWRCMLMKWAKQTSLKASRTKPKPESAPKAWNPDWKKAGVTLHCKVLKTFLFRKMSGLFNAISGVRNRLICKQGIMNQYMGDVTNQVYLLCSLLAEKVGNYCLLVLTDAGHDKIY